MTQPVVNFVDESGGLVGVSADQAQLAIEQGLRPETEQEAAQRRYSAQAGIGSAIGATAEGAADALSLGGYSYALGKLGTDQERQDALLRRNEFGDQYIAGQVLGSVAPAFFTGGSSLAATEGSAAARAAAAAGRAVTAPSRLVTAAAERAGGLAGKALVSPGAGALRQAAATGVRLGVEGAVEGAIQGAGQAIGDASLRDEDLTLQQIIAAGGDGALLGGLSMAGLGIGGSLLGSGARGIGKAASKAAGPEGFLPEISRLSDRQTLKGYTDATGAQMPRLLGADPEVVAPRRAQLLRDTFGADSDLASLQTKRVKVAEQLDASGQRVGEIVKKAEDAGFKGDANEVWSQVQRDLLDPLESGTGSQRRLAAQLVNDDLDLLRDAAQAKLPRQVAEQAVQLEKTAQAAEKAASAAEKRIEKLTLKHGEQPPLNIRAIQDKEAALADVARGKADRARAEIAKLREAHPPKEYSLTELRDLRRQLSDKAYAAKNSPTPDKPLQQLYADAAAIIERHVENKIAQAGAGAEYKAAKTLNSDWHAIDESVGARASKAQGWRDLSITDIGAGAAIAGGAIASGGTGLLGVGALVGNKLLRSSQASALTGRALSSIASGDAVRALQQAAQRSTGLRVAAAVGARLGKGIKVATPRAVVRYDQLRERADALQRNKDVYIAQLTQEAAALDGVGNLAPKYVEQQLRVTQFLSDTLPRPINTGAPTLGVKRSPPPGEMARWQRQARAATQPMTLIDDMRDGVLTRDAVAALEATKPQLLASMRAEVASELARQTQGGKQPTYQALTQFQIMLGAPVDATQTPEFARAQQAIYAAIGTAQQEQEQAQQAQLKSGGESGASKRAALPAESSLV